jgi:3-dehydroquinate dehydratase-2
MRKNILILNGPNLNLLGRREIAIYGSKSFEDELTQLQSLYPAVAIDYFQSNEENAIVEKIQKADKKYAAMIINGGAFTHTSVAIADAVRSAAIPAVEVHISNIYAREEYRKKSFLASVCKGSITGLGIDGYRLAIEHFLLSCPIYC